jgi:hypothetical protein
MPAVLRGSRIVLGSYPTPVSRIGEHLWVKRDDLTSALYGGNKVRKLELLLAAARDAGKTRVLTLGAVGSHQVVATALYGAREGFTVDAILVPQPASPHAELNVRVALAHGLHALACPAWSLAPAYVASRWGSDAYYIPLGGSNALGSLGFVDAAHEIATQVRAGDLPEPDVVIVALGSGGTAAGLAVGFEQAGRRRPRAYRSRPGCARRSVSTSTESGSAAATATRRTKAAPRRRSRADWGSCSIRRTRRRRSHARSRPRAAKVASCCTGTRCRRRRWSRCSGTRGPRASRPSSAS